MLTYSDLATKPEHWFRQSLQLFKASESLHLNLVSKQRSTTEDDITMRVGLAKGSTLLLGLALENAFKGLAIKRHRYTLNSGQLKINLKDSKSHNLASMANDLEIACSAEEENLLNRLTKATIWAAKYQIPLKEISYTQGETNISIHESDLSTAMNLLVRIKISAGFDPTSGWPAE